MRGRGVSARGQALRWREPGTGHDWPDGGPTRVCHVCRLPLHPVLVRDGLTRHLLCGPDQTIPWARARAGR